jgi:hypothetical protein
VHIINTRDLAIHKGEKKKKNLEVKTCGYNLPKFWIVYAKSIKFLSIEIFE